MIERSAAEPYVVDVRTGLDGLASLRSEWEALAQRCPEHGVSASFSIYEALLRCRHLEPGRVHFFCVREAAGRLVAICPLELTQSRIRRLKLASWGIPADPDRPCSSFLLADTGDFYEIARALSTSLKDVAPTTNLLYLERVVNGSATMAIAQGLGLHHRISSGPSLTVLDADQSGDCRLQDVSSKLRRNIRWGIRRMKRLGNLEYRVATDSEEISAGLNEFLKLESAGWKGHAPGGRALALNDRVKAHAQALVNGFRVTGDCEIHGLWLDGQCVSALLCFRAGGELYAFKIARDETFKTYSLGHLLIYTVLNNLAERVDIRTVNFGWEAGWMSPWPGRRVPLCGIYSALGGISGRAAILLLACPDRSHLKNILRPG